MDAFYASVEQRDNPELRGKPLAVGHAEQRGVVAAASYEARKYGVRSAMASQKAKRLCPDLIFVHGRMDVYKSVSRQIYEIFHDYTDIIEPLSLDEAFLDVTDNKQGISLAVDIAKEIKKRIWENLNLIASAGVSYNKFLAKIASDYRKPNGLCTIHPSQALDFIARLPIESFWGVGPVTARKMHTLGIHNGLQLRECSGEMLTRQFGKAGILYYEFARGIDNRPVEAVRIRKSVAAASYEARKYGVRSAMASQKAKRLCPDLIFVHGRMDVYKSVSRQIYEIFHDYTDIIEPLSLDEAFLDVTDNKQGISLAVDIAKEIKKRIWENLNLIASAGVSYNKFLAKIASDYRKPNGLCTIHPSQALDFIARLPIESFWGVGPVTARKMHTLGIHNGLQLRECSGEMLTRQFGKAGILYYEFARGIDNRPVEAVRIRKSVGCEHTLEKDISRKSSVIIELYHVATELIGRLERSGFKGNTLTLKVKFHDFNQITRSLSRPEELTTLDKILPLAKELLKEVEYTEHPIRLIGLSVSNPVKEEPHTKDRWEQLSFEFSDWK